MPSTSTDSWFHKTCTAPAISDHIVVPYTDDADTTQIAMARLKLLWDNKSTIKYFFLGGTQAQHRKVDMAVLEWEFFADVTLCAAEDVKDAQIRISFKDDENAANWSMLGKEALQITNVELPTMNLASINPNDPKITSAEKANILHQFGHVLGLVHEHPDPSKDGGRTVDPAAALELYSKSLGFTKDHVDSKVLDVYNAGPVSNYYRVDPTSIMRYPMPSQLNTQKVDVPFASRPSDHDRALLCIVYPRDTPHTVAPQWTQEFALDAMGVTGGPKKSILEASSIETKRYQFALWSALRTFRGKLTDAAPSSD